MHNHMHLLLLSKPRLLWTGAIHTGPWANMIEKATIILPTLDIATHVYTVGIVSLEELAIHYRKCVIQGITVVVATIVAGWVVRYPVITTEWFKGQFILHSNMAVVTQGQHLFGCKIVALFMFTTSNNMLCIAITVTVDLMITPAPFCLLCQQLLHWPVQFRFHRHGEDAIIIAP